MITVQQDVGHRVAAEDAWSGVVGVVDTTTRLERLLDGRLIVTEHSRNEPNDRLGHCKCRYFSTGQHEVAQRDLFPLHRGPDPLVETFVPTAQEEDPFLPHQRARPFLSKGRPRGREKNLVEAPEASFQPLDALEDWFGLQDHSGSAAVRTVVDGAVPIPGEVPEVHRPYLHQSLLLSDPEDRGAQVGLHGFGEQGEDEEEHGRVVPGKGRGRVGANAVRVKIHNDLPPPVAPAPGGRPGGRRLGLAPGPGRRLPPPAREFP